MATKRLPKMEKLPGQNVFGVMAEFYRLKSMVTKNMNEHQKNYVVIRLVTIIEQFFRCIVEIGLKDGTIDVPEKVELGTHILDEVASSVSRSPKGTIRNRIISLTYSFQNTKAITDLFKPKITTDQEEKNLDKLFKHRHNLVHSVDPSLLLFKEIKKHYDVTEKIMERVLDKQGHADLSFNIVKGQSLQKLDEVGGPKECFVKALHQFKNSVKLDPANPNAHFGIGLAQHHLDNHELAIKSFDEAIRLKPDIAEVHMYKGQSLCELEMYKDANRSLIAEIKVNPNNTHALLLRGLALNAIDKREMALAVIDRAIINEPGNAAIYLVKEGILRSYELHIWADDCRKQVPPRILDLFVKTSL